MVTRCHSLSLVVIRCTTRCHSLSCVVTRCTTRCHSLSLDVPLVCLFIKDLFFFLVWIFVQAMLLQTTLFNQDQKEGKSKA